MPFENSSATDPTDLLQKIVTFLTANGWTQDRSAAEGSGWTATLHKSGDYVHFRAAFTGDSALIMKTGAGATFGYGLALYMGTGFSSGAVFNDQQTGTPKRNDISTEPVGAAMNLTAGPYTNYYFFLDSAENNFACVVEKAAGIYGAIGFGRSLEKVGSWTGGPYFWGNISALFAGHLDTGPGWDSTADPPTCPCDNHGGCAAFVRCDVDAFTGKWIGIYSSTTAQISNQLGYTGKVGASPVSGDSFTNAVSEIPVFASAHSFSNPQEFSQAQTSSLDGRVNLLPILLYAQRDGSGPGYSPIGYVPGTRVTNGVGKGFAPGADYVIGSDTYTLFPKFAIKKEV